MEQNEVSRRWDTAAPGWAKWEPIVNKMLAAATEVMLDGAGVTAGGRVIDIACGAGEQSRAAARRAGAEGRVLATDISPVMLEFVAAQARAEGLGGIATHACSAEDLPRHDMSFDGAICRLGIMLMPNPAAVMNAVRDVLRPGGHFGAIVFSSPGMNPFAVEPMAILCRHAGKPVPTAGPGLFALADPAVLTSLVVDAGFDQVTVTTLDTSWELSSADEAVSMIREAFGNYRAVIGDQPEATQAAAWAEVRNALSRFETTRGFVCPGQVHVVGGRKPV